MSVCIWPISCTSCPGSLKGLMGGMYSYTMPLIFTAINFIVLLHYIYIVNVRNKKGRRGQIALLLPLWSASGILLFWRPCIWKTVLSLSVALGLDWKHYGFFALEVLLALLERISEWAITVAAQKGGKNPDSRDMQSISALQSIITCYIFMNFMTQIC